MLAIVCPGQGAQTPGFLQSWLELPGARSQFSSLSEIAGLDLTVHGTISDAKTIKDTAVAQPLIVAAGLITAKALWTAKLSNESAPESTGQPQVHTAHQNNTVLAGHSVGEITAAALAGVLTETEAMTFVTERARGMAQAATATPTGMSAVIGGDPEQVLTAIEAAGLTPANLNSKSQTVAAGTLEQLAALAAHPPARARVLPLQVAGAFHTDHMAPAIPGLKKLAESLRPRNPRPTLLSNADGAPVRSGAAALSNLITQVSRPVRWDACMTTMVELGVDRLIELAPAGTLTGLAKRAMPGVSCVAVKTPADLEAARQLLDPAPVAAATCGQFPVKGE